MRSKFMIAAGRFCFRYRAWFFPLVILSLVFFFRPSRYLPEPYYSWVIALGFVIGLGGELIRILTIGLDYIERGGKKGAPHASKLVRGGMYAHVRNPMYVGNLLMALGIALYSGSPWILVTVVPFFTFIYFAIIAAEENFLRGEFGAEYEQFCTEVNRLWPSLRGVGTTVSSMTFLWGRPIQKENGTAYYVFLGLVLFPLWRMHYLGDAEGFQQYLPYALTISAILTVAYAVIRILRAKGRLNSYN